VPQVKLDSKLIEDVTTALEPFATEMFRKRAGRWMAVVELVHSERTEPGPEEEKDTSVKVRVAQIEIAENIQHDERLREALRELYDRRTGAGTLGEVGMATSVSSLLAHGGGVLA
jgi:hypothetical protein